MKKPFVKFGLTITAFIAGIFLLLPLFLQLFAGRFSNDGSFLTIQAPHKIFDLRFLSNERLLTSGTDKVVYLPPCETRIWDVNTGNSSSQRLLPTKSLSEPVFSPDGKVLFESWSAKKEKRGGVIVRDSNSGTVNGRLEVGKNAGGRNWTLAPDHKVAAAQISSGLKFDTITKKIDNKNSFGGIKAWNVKTGKPLWYIEEFKSNVLNGYAAHRTHLAYSPNGKLLAEANLICLSMDDSWPPKPTRRTQLLLRSPANGRLLRVINQKTQEEHTDFSRRGIGWHHLVFSPDSRFLAATYDSFSISLWNVQTGRLAWEVKQTDAMINDLAFSPDGRFIARGCSLTNRIDGIGGGRVDLLDSKTGKLLRTMTRETQTDATSYAWNARIRKTQRSLQQKISKAPISWTRSADDKSFPVTHLAFSPDGKRLAAAHDDGVIKIWPVP